MQVGSRGQSLLRSQNSLLVLLTPSISYPSPLRAAKPCRTYLAIANHSKPRRSTSASNAPRHASSAAAAAQQPSPHADEGAKPSPQPLLNPSRRRSSEEIRSRQSTLLDRIRFPSEGQEKPQPREDRDRQIDSLLGIDGDSTKDIERPSLESESTLDWTESVIAKKRAEQRRKDFALAQRERGQQQGKQGKIARSMIFQEPKSVSGQQQPSAFELPEATRATATMKPRPSLGRTVEVIPDRGMDLGRALRSLDINCAVNSVRRDAYKQRFYERPGLKRKRLKSERWRRRFKIGFKAVVAKVKAMRRKGW